ncbi:response regulator [Piscinibacter sakaiensis]|uniref:Response regulatory domain-containing protein n=1 Tax=Piscinibacter sakaiensis TaxID=1547922 RepID=A0A0K8P2Q9_PISS1|nr:response regulator [Piscinibacter sakaiensis]GAP36903.1 hypothetical protein ISF6_2743 [Piscinibacter sakaiensis]
MSAPRVLLLEDDASIRRFVAMALELSGIELLECETVAQALQTLRGGPVRLIITDLMLRNESGFDLLKALDEAPTLAADARIAVFSAGLNTPTLKRLAGHRIWRVLSKPTTVAALEDCVRDALADTPASEPGAPEPATSPDEAQAIALHFGGEVRLFRTYRAACLTQFALDVAGGDSAVARRDAAELRRLGHSLKSVLKMLGQPEAAERAAALDRAAAGTDWPETQQSWAALREHLLALGPGPVPA